MKRGLIIFVLGLFLVSFASAENHYATQDGAGSMDGSSLGNAWSVANFNNIANWNSVLNTNDKKIGPGDTVYFSGTITGQITPQGPGKSGNPIILDGYELGDCNPITSECTSSAYFSNSVKINKDYIKIQDIRFSDLSRAVIIGEGGPYVTGAEVRNCAFGKGTWASLIVYRGNDCIIDGNYLNNHVGNFPDGSKPGQNIQILGGKRNIITNNVIIGGKTGIILKYARDGNGGGYDSFFEDNIIMYNDVGSHTEEGISIDANFHSATTATIDYDLVSSINSAEITLSDSEFGGGNDPNLIGYYIVPVTGSAIGQYKKITGQSGATFTVESAFTGLLAGDGVSIMGVFKDNLIAYNTVTGGYDKSQIILYGNAFNNRIEHNQLEDGRGGISIRSIDRAEPSVISVTGNGERGPCGYNLIQDNTAYQIYIRYRCLDQGGSYGPYNSYGNTVIDNTITDVLNVNYQYYYSSGNTGGYSLSETNGNDCSGTISPYAVALQSSPVDLSLGVCSEGKITDWCSCDGMDYPSGYCCSGVWQAYQCSTATPYCGDTTCNNGETCGATNNAPECNLDCGTCPLPQQQNPIIHYTMDSGDISGGKVLDTSGNHIDATVYGIPQQVTGKISGALHFNGVNDYLDTGYTNQIVNWTVSVWVKGDSNPASSKDAGPVMKEENFNLAWDHTASRFIGSVGLRVGNTWYPASFGTLVNSTWYNLVGTYDGETLRAYRDGQLITSNTDPSGIPYTAAASMKIARHAVNNYFFAGDVDDVKIWNRVLSASEIQNLYLQGDGSSCNSLADSNSDGVISISELINYISQWKTGSVTIENLIDAIEKWKSGC